MKLISGSIINRLFRAAPVLNESAQRAKTVSHLEAQLNAQIEENKALKAEIAGLREEERTRKNGEKQLRRWADNTIDMVAEIDANNIIQFASPSYHPALGYDPQALLGTNIFDMLHPDDRDKAMAMAHVSAVGHLSGKMRLRVRHADGHYVFVDSSGSPIYDDQEKLIGFVVASRDVTIETRAEAAIQESERKFRNIIEMLPLGTHIYSLQDDDRLVLVGYNPAANAILKVDHEQFLGKTIEEAFPGLIYTEIPTRYREVARLGYNWVKEQIDYDHGQIQGAYEVHAFQTSPGNMVAVFLDIAERARVAEALRYSEDKFSKAFLTSPDSININRLSDSVYIDINQGFTRLTGYTREEALGKSSLELNIWADPEDRASLVRGLQEKGQVENLEAQFHRKNGEIGIGLMSASIIVIKGEKCILSITRDITERIQAERELRETHSKLAQAYDATLQGWAQALELREHETADHSRRVVGYTMQVARMLGINDDELVNIQRGALLHDIGKMGVPDEILLKPGRLSPDEWVTMRQHTDFGKVLLSGIDYLRPCISIPYCHHEKWDGTGYPQGLKGTEIPLPARIFAVVDVYDALTHNRPYRPAWSRPDARRYLIEQSGKHFDPEIVDLFLNIV